MFSRIITIGTKEKPLQWEERIITGEDSFRMHRGDKTNFALDRGEKEFSDTKTSQKKAALLPSLKK